MGGRDRTGCGRPSGLLGTLIQAPGLNGIARGDPLAIPRSGEVALPYRKSARLGIVDYPKAWDIQLCLAQQIRDGQRPNILLLLEHLPVYTKGRLSQPSHFLLNTHELEERGIPVYETDRGGQVTYHGPGQVVGYPVLSLRQWGGPLKRDFPRPLIIAGGITHKVTKKRHSRRIVNVNQSNDQGCEHDRSQPPPGAQTPTNSATLWHCLVTRSRQRAVLLAGRISHHRRGAYQTCSPLPTHAHHHATSQQRLCTRVASAATYPPDHAPLSPDPPARRTLCSPTRL